MKRFVRNKKKKVVCTVLSSAHQKKIISNTSPMIEPVLFRWTVLRSVELKREKKKREGWNTSRGANREGTQKALSKNGKTEVSLLASVLRRFLIQCFVLDA